MKRLILSTIPEDFNPSKDILLGPWCFIDKEELYPEWETLPFEPDPFPTPEHIKKASQITCAYANRLVPDLAKQLNEQNGCDYSDQFWRVMILPWLLTVIQVLWERQCRIQNCFNKYSHNPIRVQLVADTLDWRFQDTKDFLYRGVLNPLFNEWLYSRLIESNIPPKWQIRYVEKRVRAEEILPRQKGLKRYLRRCFNYLFGNLLCTGVYGINQFEAILWAMFLRIKPVLINARTKYIYKKKYTNITNIKWLVDFDNLVQLTLPKCFRDLSTIKTKKPNFCTGGIRIIGPLLWYNENIKYYLGLSLEAGEKLVLTQHGGNYGNAKVFPLPSELEYIHHSFFSWGWNQQEDYKGNIKPLASPYISKYYDKHVQRTDNLILVGTRANLFSYRLDTMPQSLDQLSYRKNKIIFLKELRIDVFNETLYRPYFNDYGSLKDRSYFKKKFADIRICEGKLNPQILKCKLLVLDHPGTTLNIALAANIPMIGFWDKKAWAMCKQAVPYFEALENTGVLFQAGQDAARKVNQIWDDLKGWWSQEQIQKARKDWCYQYARTSKFWWLEWAKALWKM